MILATLLQAETVPHEELNALGAIFMIVSVGFVTILTFWCFYRVLSFREEPPQPVQDFHSA